MASHAQREHIKKLGRWRRRATQPVHTFQDLCMLVSARGRPAHGRANWRIRLYLVSQEKPKTKREATLQHLWVKYQDVVRRGKRYHCDRPQECACLAHPHPAGAGKHTGTPSLCEGFLKCEICWEMPTHADPGTKLKACKYPISPNQLFTLLSFPPNPISTGPT